MASMPSQFARIAHAQQSSNVPAPMPVRLDRAHPMHAHLARTPTSVHSAHAPSSLRLVTDSYVACSQVIHSTSY